MLLSYPGQQKQCTHVKHIYFEKTGLLQASSDLLLTTRVNKVVSNNAHAHVVKYT